MSKQVDEQDCERGAIVAFRAPQTLVEDIERAAAIEGISKSDVARRAVIRDLANAKRAS